MKKTILIIVISCILFSSGVVASNVYKEYTAKETEYIIELDGETVNLELPVVSIEDNTYVALRKLCEKLGYTVEWLGEEGKITLSKNKEKELPYYEDLTISQNGSLSNGRKYNYISKADFSCQEQIAQWGLTAVNVNNGEVPTAKMAAEIGQVILGYNYDDKSDISMEVYFDKAKDAWFVFGLNNSTVHSGLRVVVIQREDGRIIDKYELR